MKNASSIDVDVVATVEDRLVTLLYSLRRILFRLRRLTCTHLCAKRRRNDTTSNTFAHRIKGIR